eukprot:4417156-Prymnesium_polylepis.2
MINEAIEECDRQCQDGAVAAAEPSEEIWPRREGHPGDRRCVHNAGVPQRPQTSSARQRGHRVDQGYTDSLRGVRAGDPVTGRSVSVKRESGASTVLAPFRDETV